MRQENYVWVCYQPGSAAFYCDLFLFLYLGVLQIVGLILAFQTRKVKIPILNDSKFVAALVYISSVVFVALVLVTFSLPAHINISNGIFSAGIMLLATISLILMFVPKVWSEDTFQHLCESVNMNILVLHAQCLSVRCLSLAVLRII